MSQCRQISHNDPILPPSLPTGEFIRDLVALPSGGSGGVVWRIRASHTKLICAVGSRNGTEETKLLVLDFDARAPTQLPHRHHHHQQQQQLMHTLQMQPNVSN